jgi:coenzyme F420-0:L-glutamate ligase / coenzyme F420-1:gamma-L-glutamate ligase
MSALVAKFPFLEMIHVRKGTAGGTTDDKVHGKEVMGVVLLNIYRRIFLPGLFFYSFCDRTVQLAHFSPAKIIIDRNDGQNPEPERNSYIVSSSHRDVMENIQVMGVQGLPLIHAGDDITQMICSRMSLQDGDILCIASTIYSKAKGYTQKLSSITPSERAERLGKLNGEDPRFVQAVLDASADIIMEHPFILSELAFGHIGVRAGVDQSNIEDGMVIFLPPDPMKSAGDLREEIKKISGTNVGIIITDTCGRSFRRGQTGNAIGWSGFTAIRDFRGDTDLFGHVLKITEEAVADEIAGFANFVMGESNNGVPAVVFRNCPKWTGHDNLYFSSEEDITKNVLKKEWS